MKKTHRRLPHWERAGSTYFITFRLASGELSAPERTLIFDHIRDGDERFYTLVASAVMPDHVHVVLKPRQDASLSNIMKGIKGVSARRLNQLRGTRGIIWQAESWDRIIRDDVEFSDVLQYLVDNPAKAGLCRSSEIYPWLFLEKRYL